MLKEIILHISYFIVIFCLLSKWICGVKLHLTLSKENSFYILLMLILQYLACMVVAMDLTFKFAK